MSLPDTFASCHSAQRIVMHVECAAYHERFYRERADDYGPRIRSAIEMGLIMPASKYIQAQRLRRQFRDDMVDMVRQVDVVMTPATVSPAPKDLNTTGDAAFQVPWTSSGLPTVVVPSGLSELGLPMPSSSALCPTRKASCWAQPNGASKRWECPYVRPGMIRLQKRRVHWHPT